jgi:hypothetical protein
MGTSSRQKRLLTPFLCFSRQKRLLTPFLCRITYADNTVSVFLNSQKVIEKTGIDLGLLTGPTQVALGSYAGDAYQNQDVSRWTYTGAATVGAAAVPEPSSMTSAALGLIGLAGYVMGRRWRGRTNGVGSR